MATLDFGGVGRDEPARRGFRAALEAGWSRLQSRRRERRALEAAARLGPRLMRDAGFDPERVEETAAGWDRLDPVGIWMLLPGGTHP